MNRSALYRTLLTVSAASACGVALAQPQQQVTGPVAVYWMTAETSSGFGMGGAGGPNIGAMMGGGGANKTLTLQLGSSRRPAGEPSAEHLPPAGLRAGQSLPLVTPRVVPPETGPTPTLPPGFERPQGRMLIFWGCGERAPAGQPVVIDMAQLGAGGAAALRGIEVAAMQPPAPGRNTTYGDWPNERARTTVPADGSLVGPHVVRGNYSPEINFSLSAGQDFLAPLNLIRNAEGPAGEVQLGWNSVPNALGYFAVATGAGRNNNTFVFWSSSQAQNAAFSAPDYMSPSEVNRLVQNRTLMGPQQTSCSVYKEVKEAMETGIVMMTAYGDETNVSYPPRPENRAQPWNIEWQVKVRRKSTTSGLLGMDMAALMGGRGATSQPQYTPPAPQGGYDPLNPNPPAPQDANPPAPPPQQPQQQPRRGFGIPGIPGVGVGDVIRGLGR